jgi:indole-3-glycerol phosphate synthase
MSSNILDQILARKRKEVSEAMQRVPEEALAAKARLRDGQRSFIEALSSPGPFGANVIAEVKRGSPSRGLMRPDLDAASTAAAYQQGGAEALSVLTDSTFFFGGLEDLIAARQATRLPVLRKDFIISTYQIYEAAVMGADAILLIARAVNLDFLRQGIRLCKELGLDALVEIHSEDDLEMASVAGAKLIGINNRDLRTFKTDIALSAALAQKLKPGQIAVAESGISDRSQIEILQSAGIWNFLIGESLVNASDPVVFLGTLLGKGEDLIAQ